MKIILCVFTGFLFTALSAKTANADITVPIIYVENAIPAVSLTVNGTQIPELSIDTGAPGGLYLLPPVFEQVLSVQKNKTKETQAGIDIFGGQHSTEFIRNATVTVNGETVSGTDVFAFNPWGAGMTAADGRLLIDGVLGLGVVSKNRSLIINFAAKQLTIANNPAARPEGYRWQPIDFTRSDQGIVINVRGENNNSYRMMIDTGASHTVLFNRNGKGCATPSLSCPRETIITPDAVTLSALLFQVSDSRINYDGLLGNDYLSDKVLFISADTLLIGVR